MFLTLLFAVVSVVPTALICYGGVSPWWIFPLWLGFFLALSLVYILVVVLGLFLFLPKEIAAPRLRRFTHWVMKVTLDWILTTVGMRVKVLGVDKLPDVPFLWVCNHRSAFDPLCAIPNVAAPIVFVCKPGVMKIPVIGSILERIGFLAIDRENPRNAVTTIKQAAELIKGGLSVGIYPEGTRSRTGDLLPFHAGSFKIAKLAGCPVAVASVRVKKGIFFPSYVELRVLDVMEVDYVTEMGTAPMSERAETAIRADLGL